LQFDPEKYRKYLPETDWSEKVQEECLNTLWNVISAFVDLGFGTDSDQNISKTTSWPENLQPVAQGTSNPHNVRKSLKATEKCRRIQRTNF
jgi:hypothetical protein